MRQSIGPFNSGMFEMGHQEQSKGQGCHTESLLDPGSTGCGSHEKLLLLSDE